MSHRISRMSFLAFASALVCASCAAGNPLPSAPSPALPVYEGRATELFDDGIAAQAIGPGVHAGASAGERELLRERTRGDCVLRARVVTLALAEDESGPRWVLGLHPVETLTGKLRMHDDFVLRIDGRSPGAGLLRALDGQIVGAPVVAFLREFAPAEGSGRAELHFHLAGDAKDEVDAVRVAALAGEMGQ
jgi:hypothetical protein